MKIKNKAILIVSLSGLALTHPTQTTPFDETGKSSPKKTTESFSKKAFKVAKKTTSATSYFAIGTAFAFNCAAMAYSLFYLMKNKDKFQMKAAQLALKYFTNTPKIICNNLIPASITVISASALGSLYTSIKMFTNMYKTIKN